MSSNCCRSCGKTSEGEFKTSIYDIIEGKLSYKDVIEKNMGGKLSADKFLPKMICEVCKAQLSLICALGFTWKNNEKALVTPNKIRQAISQIAIDFQKEKNNKSTPPGYARKRGPIPKIKVKMETEDRPFFLYSQIPDYHNQGSASKVSRSVNCFNNIRELFAEELAFKNVLKDMENYSHIRVDQEYLTENGELCPDWLQAFDGTMKWTDFVYTCSHCNTEIVGLFAYMEHMREAGVKSFKIHCGEKPCAREFAALYSYINHLADHHEHLRFSCIFCSPSRIFLNIPCLINHYLDSHANINFQIYVCIECGHYCQNITQLRIHKMSQHDKVQDIDNPSSDDSDEEKPKKQKMSDDFEWKFPTPNGLKRVKSRSLNALNATPSKYNLARKSLEGHPGKNFHPKVHDVANRTTYPCTIEGCDRILITPAGLEYHLLTHSGEKPYKCSLCSRAFRSKASLSNHESTKHCVTK